MGRSWRLAVDEMVLSCWAGCGRRHCRRVGLLLWDVQPLLCGRRRWMSCTGWPAPSSLFGGCKKDRVRLVELDWGRALL